MKVLFLGNSNDTGSFVRPEEKQHDAVAQRLSAAFETPVELVARNCWPNDRMTTVVEGWVEEIQPDMIFLNITRFPFTYEPTPLRVKRLLGRVGEPVGDAGFRLARSRRWSHNPVFRGLRSLAQATIGGDTHFTVDEVVERYSELIRTLLRREGLVVAVKGPRGKSNRGLTRRQRTRLERRRLEVHRPLSELCRQLHVPYFGTDAPLWSVRPLPKGTQAGDGMHANARGQVLRSEDHFEFIRDAWAQHLAQAGIPGHPDA